MDSKINLPEQAADVTSMTAAIVSAYVSANRVQPNELSEMIRVVHAALFQLGRPTAPVQQKQKQEPAVAIRRSVTPDYIVCLEDGKKLKMLKRHLRTTYGMSPEEYRAKWNLPAEYPMAAPNYRARRSDLAKKIGLGRKPAMQPEPAPGAAPAVRSGKKAA